MSEEQNNDTEDKGLSEYRWKKRRTVIYLTLIFCACCITYLMVLGKDNELNNTIANGLLFLASSVIIAYVGGSAYEDTRVLNKRNTKDPFR